MDFHIETKHTNIRNPDLLKDLQKVASKLGKAPTISEYNSSGTYEATVFLRRFGSWNNALMEINLLPNNVFWTDEELFQNLYNAWVTKGRQPTRRDMDNKALSTISSGSYLRHFKTWTKALESFVNWVNKGNSVENEKIEPQNTTHKTKRDINLRLRFLVMKRDNFKCCICGRSPSTTLGLELQIDHIIPWASGGETVIENLQTLCKDCNLGKSDLNS